LFFSKKKKKTLTISLNYILHKPYETMTKIPPITTGVAVIVLCRHTDHDGPGATLRAVEGKMKNVMSHNRD